ncbi:MAG: hypothetical protein ACE364_00025 [Chlorobiota bacterium]
MKTFLTLLSFLLLTSCYSSRYSSDLVLNFVDFENVDSISISNYGSSIYSDTATTYTTMVYTRLIDTTKSIEVNESDTLLKNKIVDFFNSIPDSRPRAFLPDSLLSFKKRYLNKMGIDTLDIDSVYNMPRKLRKQRNVIFYSYSLEFHFKDEAEESIYFYNYDDNVISYSFCCIDYHSWMYRNIYKYMKNYSVYGREYILDIEFQKRFVRLFNDILTKYNEINGTDYPLLDVDYEVWSGIISAP